MMQHMSPGTRTGTQGPQGPPRCKARLGTAPRPSSENPAAWNNWLVFGGIPLLDDGNPQ